MGQAIGDVLPLAIGVAISPVPIIAIILMLGTPRARSTGPAFTAGWLAGLTIAGGIALVLASGSAAADSGEPADWVGVLKLALGLLFLLLAVKQWRSRPSPGQEAAMPKWMQAIDTFTPRRSFAIAAALSAVNPKNLLLTVGAAAAIAQTGASTGTQAVALAVFVLVGTLGPGIPVAIYFAMGDRAARPLDELQTWMGEHNAAIMATICLVIGAKLIGDGITGLT